MKKNYLFLKPFLLVAGTMLFATSCQDSETLDDKAIQDIAYNREFVKVFGEIDPNQNWDLFGQLASGVRPAGTRAGAGDVQITQEPTFDVTREMSTEYSRVLRESDARDRSKRDTNLGIVTQDFITTASEFTIGQVHYNTIGIDVIGIYWYANDGDTGVETIRGGDGQTYRIVKVPIYNNKSNVVGLRGNGDTFQKPGDRPQASQWYFDNGAVALRTTPIHVVVPSSVSQHGYGFYIQNNYPYEGGIRFSEAKLNQPVHFRDAGAENGHFVATFDIHDFFPEQESQRYLCFEDWMGGATNFDLNDLVFTVDLAPTTIIDHESNFEFALLVCEDLASYDFDFNDDILLLAYRDAKTYKTIQDPQTGAIIKTDIEEDVRELNITAMAAGGRFKSTITINGQEWDEIHSLLHESGTHSDYRHEIINATGIFSPDSLGETITIPKENLPDRDNSYPTYLSQLFLKHNFFKMEGIKDGQANIIQSGGDFTRTGTAPQMMLLPIYFEWPKEMVPIIDAYEGFSSWVEDYTQVDWINTTQVENLTVDRGDLFAEGNNTRITATDEPLDFANGQSFTCTIEGTQSTVSNCARIDFTKDWLANLQQNNNYYGKLTVKFTQKPDAPVYLFFSDGTLILKDEHGTNVEQAYILNKNQFIKACSDQYIYLVGTGSDPEIIIEKVEIDVWH